MRGTPFLRRLAGPAIACATMLSLAIGTSAQGITPHTVQASSIIHPKYTLAGKTTDATKFACQSASASPRCYTPQQIRKAYQTQSLINDGITGKGRTIVIVDAYQSPTIREDLATFDKLFGLPDPEMTIYGPDSFTLFDQNDPNMVGWAGEITLDVEWAHAIAPDAKIALVLAKSNEDTDILHATQYAIEQNLGDVISMSFGEAEACIDPTLLKAEHALFQQATSKHITLIASSGDQGAAQVNCMGIDWMQSASSPANDPLVMGVGGTSLNANQNTGKYISETTWNDAYGASGGGFSTIYKTPTYQQDVSNINKRRGVPDVAYAGDVNGGVLTVWSTSGLGPNLVFVFGGTSAGAPQWAGITALADQMAHKRLGFLNSAIYRIGKSDDYSAAFHDVRTGNNTYVGVNANNQQVTVPGYNATRGWDAVTGWGSPNVANLIPLLIDYHRNNDDANAASW